MKNRHIFIVNAIAAAAAAALTLSCSSENPIGKEETSEGGTVRNSLTPPACTAAPAGDAPDVNSPNLGFEKAIVITFNETDSPTVVNPYPVSEINVTRANGHVVSRIRLENAQTEPIIYVLNGRTSDGSFKFNIWEYNDAIPNIHIYLNGVSITNPNGPAFSLPSGLSGDTAVFHLVGGCGKENLLVGGAGHTTTGSEQAKGTIFSEAAVAFTGSGILEVRSKNTTGDRHAIAVDNTLTIESGNIIIPESTRDGIHVNRTFEMTGGSLQIQSAGDAIQTEREPGVIKIGGGLLTLLTTGAKSHGFASDSNDVVIAGGDISVLVAGDGAKGVRSRRNVGITGGTIVLETRGNRAVNQTDDGDTTSNAVGIKAGADFSMSGGNLTVRSKGSFAKGISVDGNAAIGGPSTIWIDAQDDGVKVDGTLTISAGTVEITSRTKDAIDAVGGYQPGSGADIKLHDRNGGGF